MPLYLTMGLDKTASMMIKALPWTTSTPNVLPSMQSEFARRLSAERDLRRVWLCVWELWADRTSVSL